jgi:hypothetical protein
VAARFEQVDIITYLLSSAADKEAKDNQGVLRAGVHFRGVQPGRGDPHLRLLCVRV